MSKNWIGKTINNRYQIEKLLGQGGMSAVYQGIDPNLRRPVAIKLIHSHLSTNPNFIHRFKEEAAAVARLRHPHIVQVFDFNADGDTYFMVMEYLIGETLQDRIWRNNKKGRYIPFSEVTRIGLELCDAIGYAHTQELIHRDIKPANVMLNLNNQAILLDFGIVKIIGGEYHTITGATIGTVAYMSPEQMRSERIDERTDIYSLGITLFEMISGQTPYQADSTPSLIMMVLNDPLPDLTVLRENVPDGLLHIVQKAMAKDQEQRFQSMADMRASLLQIQERLREIEPTETVAEVDAEIHKPDSVNTHNQVTIKDTISKEQKGEDSADIFAFIPTELDQPEVWEKDNDHQEKLEEPPEKPVKLIIKIIPIVVSMLLALLMAIGWYIVNDSRKPPEITLAPISVPATLLTEQTAEFTTGLGTWQTNSMISDLAISPNSTRIGTSNNRNLPFYAKYRFYNGLWDWESGRLKQYFTGHALQINSITFSPDGHLFASASDDDMVLIRDTVEGELRESLDASGGGVTSIGFSHNNLILCAGTWDGLIRLWQVDNYNLLRTMQIDDFAILDVQFSPDDTLLAAASHNNVIQLWSVSDGTLLHTMEGHTAPVISIDFSTDGSLLASGSEDSTIKLWRVSDGELLKTLKGHTDMVLDVAISPDSSLIASGSDDNSLRIWRVSDGHLLILLTPGNDSITSVAFSPNGKLLISGGEDGLIQFWGISEAIPLGKAGEDDSP